MPRIVDHDARRAELLDGAFELFADRGWAALTMRGIARELGVSTGTLYHYFDGKVAMARAMYRRRVGRDIADVEEQVPRNMPPLEAAAAIAAFILSRPDDLQRSLLVAIDFSRQEGDDVRDIILENVSAYRSVIGERLGLDEAGASAVLSMFFGIFVQRHLDPDAVDLPAQLQALATLVLK
jgi:AcrR family transcriptional regulator